MFRADDDLELFLCFIIVSELFTNIKPLYFMEISGQCLLFFVNNGVLLTTCQRYSKVLGAASTRVSQAFHF